MIKSARFAGCDELRPAQEWRKGYALDIGNTTIFKVKTLEDAEHIKRFHPEGKKMAIRKFSLSEYQEHRDNKNSENLNKWNKGYGYAPPDDTKQGEWRAYDGEQAEQGSPLEEMRQAIKATRVVLRKKALHVTPQEVATDIVKQMDEGALTCKSLPVLCWLLEDAKQEARR